MKLLLDEFEVIKHHTCFLSQHIGVSLQHGNQNRICGACFVFCFFSLI